MQLRQMDAEFPPNALIQRERVNQKKKKKSVIYQILKTLTNQNHGQSFLQKS